MVHKSGANESKDFLGQNRRPLAIGLVVLGAVSIAVGLVLWISLAL
jgi:hypothetical protein